MMCKQKAKSKERGRERERGVRKRQELALQMYYTDVLPSALHRVPSLPLLSCSPTLFCSAQVTAAVAVALLLLLAWYAALSGMLCVRLSVPPAKCVGLCVSASE